MITKIKAKQTKQYNFTSIYDNPIMMILANNTENYPLKQTSNDEKEFVPSDQHILCGRGHLFGRHPANQKFNAIIRHYVRNYKESTSRHEKTEIFRTVLAETYDSGLSFMKLDNTTQQWYRLANIEAREKIGHALRDKLRTSIRSNPKKSTQDTSRKVIVTQQRPRLSVILDLEFNLDSDSDFDSDSDSDSNYSNDDDGTIFINDFIPPIIDFHDEYPDEKYTFSPSNFF